MSKSKPIPAVAGEMVERARRGGCEVIETLQESHGGLIGSVKLRKPSDPAPFLVIYIGERSWSSKRRPVAYIESSGRVTQRLANRALRVVLREIKAENEQAARTDERKAAIEEIAARHPELLTCDGPDGCGATYVDSMNHTRGEHDRRRNEQVAEQYPELPCDAARILHAATAAGIEVSRGPVSFALRHPDEAQILVVHDGREPRSRIARDGLVPQALSASAVLYGIEQHALRARLHPRVVAIATSAALVYRSQHVAPRVSAASVAADPWADEPPTERPTPCCES